MAVKGSLRVITYNTGRLYCYYRVLLLLFERFYLGDTSLSINSVDGDSGHQDSKEATIFIYFPTKLPQYSQYTDYMRSPKPEMQERVILVFLEYVISWLPRCESQLFTQESLTSKQGRNLYENNLELAERKKAAWGGTNTIMTG